MEVQLKEGVLALTTSGTSGSVALFKERLLLEITFIARESYARGLFKALFYLKENYHQELEEIQYLAVDIGPGSFTGLRIGLSVAKALSLIKELKILPLSSLEILAWNYPLLEFPLLSIIDAYSKELFVALYKWDKDHLQVLHPPSLIPFEEVEHLVREPTLFLSETLEKWEEKFRLIFGEKFLKPPSKPRISASLLAEIALIKLVKGEILPYFAEEILPLYLKPSEAERKRCFTFS